MLADGGEGLVGRLEGQGEVIAGHGGGHEPVVPGVQVGTTAQGLRDEHAGQLVVLIPGEGEVGHHRRAGVVDGQVPRPGLVQDPVAQLAAHPVHGLDGVFVLQGLDGGNGGGHRDGGEPE